MAQLYQECSSSWATHICSDTARMVVFERLPQLDQPALSLADVWSDAQLDDAVEFVRPYTQPNQRREMRCLSIWATCIALPLCQAAGRQTATVAVTGLAPAA